MKLLLLLALVSPLTAKNHGSVHVDGYGEIFVVGKDIPRIHMEENGFSINGGGAIRFSKEARDDFAPEMYWAVSIIILI